MNKIDIEISVTKKGYDMKVKQGGEQILFRAFEYKGNGLTDCVADNGKIEIEGGITNFQFDADYRGSMVSLDGQCHDVNLKITNIQ